MGVVLHRTRQAGTGGRVWVEAIEGAWRGGAKISGGGRCDAPIKWRAWAEKPSEI